MDYRLIIFDVDGTLAESDDYMSEKLSAPLRKVMPRKAADTVGRQIAMAGETVVHTGARLMDLIELDGVFHKLHEKVSVDTDYKYEPIAGMQDVVTDLAADHQLALITTGGSGSTRAFLKKYGIGDCFNVIISGEDCHHIKPSPEPIRQVLELSGVKPEKCLMVGDTIFDILSAHRAGVRCAAVKSGFDHEWLLRLYKADYILESVRELPDLLRSEVKSQELRVKSQEPG